MVKNILLYFDTSALVTEFHNEIDSDLVSKIITSTNRNDLQIISSIWTINEIIAVMDKISQKINEKTGMFELSNIDIKKIVSTIVERIRKIINNENAMFNFVYLDHNIIKDSRILTKDFHLSPTDAIHMFTGYAYNCNYFVTHNKYFINQFPFKKYGEMKLIDLKNENDRKLLESEELNL
jgi:predicted nucleic acid-binding protein